MAYTSINKPEDYFNTVLYTGDATSDRTITNTFGTDFLWLKERNGTDDHHLWDKVRGDGKRLQANLTNAESDLGTYIALVSTGFKVSGGTYNNSGSQYAAWQWLANGTGVSNTDGTITSSVSANTTAGFSIVSYTGNGTAGATIGHSLGTTPSMIIVKERDNANNWFVYHTSLGATKHMILQDTDAEASFTTTWNDTEPTSSVFSVGSGAGTNRSSGGLIAYCFAEKKGFSKFGSYTGNGNADGPMVYTGFKPAFVLQKNTSVTQGWQLQDNKRLGYNPDNYLLQPHTNQSESALQRVDLLSNGFKVRTTDAGQNASGNNYIYMAFAESPFTTSTGVPTTAR